MLGFEEMDNSWQTKCGAPFQPSSSATVSSDASQEPRGHGQGQMDTKAGHCLYPRVAHGLRSKFVGGMQDPVYPSFLFPANHGSGHADAGNSFLALLYAPPSLLQRDLQELSDPKPSTLSGNFTAGSGNFIVDSIGSGTFLTSNVGLIKENVSNHNLQSWADTSPDTSSRSMVGLRGGNNSVFQDLQSSNTAAQATVPGGEKAREPLSSWGPCCGTSIACNLNVCSSDIQAMPNMALEQCSSKQAIPFGECPRVFCMGKSGFLLLSNTGLLGIVCSCHWSHMSVLKFCEHSGLNGVNPGDSVHMESGETIAQWQKLYFLKFGIRSPGNEGDWDWPGVLTTGSLMKSNSSASNMPKSEFSRIFSSSEVILRFGKPSDYVIIPKNVHTDHNLSIGAFPRKQLTTVQDGCNIPLKGACISQNNLHARLNSQLLESNLATYTTEPNFVGNRLAGGCHTLPPFLDSLEGNENLPIAHSPSQIPISLLKDHESIMNKNAKNGLVCRDASSSNIELRLGQPPQTGNPVLSVIEPPPFNAFVSPPKLQPLKQMTHNNLSREEELWNNFSYAAGQFNSKMVEQQPKLKFMNYTSGVSNSLGAVRARSETNNMAKDLVFPPLPQFNPQPEWTTNASEKLVNEGAPIVPKILHSGICTTQFEPTNVLLNSNGRIGRQLNNSALGFNNLLVNDTVVSCAKDFCAEINSGIRISKRIEHPSSFTIAGGGSSDNCISAVNGKICESHHESCLLFDRSVGANFWCDSKKVSSIGQDNHVTSGTAIPSEGILKGFPFLVASSTSNQNPTLLQQQDTKMETYLLDENRRLLALKQILELSRQQHALYLHEMNQKQERSCNISKVQHYRNEASTSEHVTSGAALKFPQNKGTCGNHEIAGLNRYCRLSALAPIPMHSKEKESQCKNSYDLRNEETSLRDTFETTMGVSSDS